MSSDKTRTFLVIDDEPLIAELVSQILADLGVIRIATCGREAIRLIEDGVQFAVILCDLGLPDVPGQFVYEAFKRASPELAERVIFTTGGTIDPELDLFLKAVPNERLYKPFSLSELRAAVASVLEPAGA